VKRVKVENEELQAKVNRLVLLEAEVTALNTENTRLNKEVQHLKKELFSCQARLLEANQTISSNEANKQELPNIRKESRKPEILIMIGSALISILSIIMAKTQQSTHLLTLCEAIFDKMLFGEVHTEKVWKGLT